MTGGREHQPTPEEMARFWALWEELGGTVLLHGAADGVDIFVAYAVKARGFEVLPFPVRADLDGGAGIPYRAWPCRRNGRMLRDGKAEVLFVFPGNRGTADCERQAKGRPIPTYRMRCDKGQLALDMGA